MINIYYFMVVVLSDVKQGTLLAFGILKIKMIFEHDFACMVELVNGRTRTNCAYF